jgi:hypothetical protein
MKVYRQLSERQVVLADNSDGQYRIYSLKDCEDPNTHSRSSGILLQHYIYNPETTEYRDHLVKASATIER